jgi:hypothetical protein
MVGWKQALAKLSTLLISKVLASHHTLSSSGESSACDGFRTPLRSYRSSAVWVAASQVNKSLALALQEGVCVSSRWGKGKARQGKVGVPIRRHLRLSHPFLSQFLPLSSLHCLLITHTISTDLHSDDPGCGTSHAQAINHQQNCLAASHLRHGSRAPGRVRYSIFCP